MDTISGFQSCVWITVLNVPPGMVFIVVSGNDRFELGFARCVFHYSDIESPRKTVIVSPVRSNLSLYIEFLPLVEEHMDVMTMGDLVSSSGPEPIILPGEQLYPFATQRM